MLIGEILIRQGDCLEKDILHCLEVQKQYGGRTGEILINLGCCSEDAILTALQQQFDIPLYDQWVEDFGWNGEPELHGLEADWCENMKIVPLVLDDGKFFIALTDPLDLFLLESLALRFDCEIAPVLIKTHELRHLQSFLEAGSDIDDRGELQDIAMKEAASGAPIIKFVNDMIQRAADMGASDIHIDAERKGIRVRFRIDGILRNVDRLSFVQGPAVISRIKLMAALDISEKRMPQDGGIRLKVNNTDLDIRVATTPCLHGENAILRLLTQSKGALTLAELGLREDHSAEIKNWLLHPNGVIIVTGPTGSGKTTTLYGFLQTLLNERTKIITIEDPVENQVDGVTQIQVQHDIGLTFAKILRSILRQDPDIVLVGELRDRETAQIAIQASLTGHLVLTTLHTNDALGAITRLMDMGIENYLLPPTIIGVVAQRLVRKVCPHCSEVDKMAMKEAVALGWSNTIKEKYGVTGKEKFMLAKGCKECDGQGYKGRMGIFEMLPFTTKIKKKIIANGIPDIDDIPDVRTLREDGLLCAALGKTTVEEIRRVT